MNDIQTVRERLNSIIENAVAIEANSQGANAGSACCIHKTATEIVNVLNRMEQENVILEDSHNHFKEAYERLRKKQPPALSETQNTEHKDGSNKQTLHEPPAVDVTELFNQAREELQWLKDTAEDDRDYSRIVGYEDAFRHFLPLERLTQQDHIGGWQTIEAAPKDGTRFMSLQDGEIYHTAYDKHKRIMFRIHSLHEPKTYAYVKAKYQGKEVEAKHLIEEGEETFEHNWCFWTRGFEFKPTHWTPLPKPPSCEDER